MAVSIKTSLRSAMLDPILIFVNRFAINYGYFDHEAIGYFDHEAIGYFDHEAIGYFDHEAIGV